MIVERKLPAIKVNSREHKREGYKKSSRWMLFKQILEREMKARKLND